MPERNATPDATWTDNELLAEYNRFSPTQRRARFRTKDMAILSISNARRDHAARGATQQILNDALVATPSQPAPVATRAKRAKKDAPNVAAPKRVAGQKRSPKNVRARMASLTINVSATTNPYREGSKAHAHFEKMKGADARHHITVLEYLAKFTEQDQKNARQYLWNAIQDEHVKTMAPKAE